jgi:hypothetical protein
MMKTRMILATAAAAALTLAACGDDDDTASEATTVPATTEAPATTAAATTAAPATTAATTEAPATTEASASGDASSTGGGTATDDPYCALALEMDSQESLPTAEQLTQAQELAPPELQEAASIAAPPLIAAGDDPVAFFAAYAQDDVEQAVEQLNAYEDANCGTDHGSNEPPEGASREVEPDATTVDVVASDYMFDMADTLDAGRTSFVLTNQGHEAHFLEIVKLAEGVTIEQALAAEDPSEMIEGDWSTGLAAPDGVDDEVITFDLEPGNYAALCFISGPDGTPHAFMGMQKEFTVS